MLGFVRRHGGSCHWQVASARGTSPSAFVILEVRAAACCTSCCGQVIVLLVPDHVQPFTAAKILSTRRRQQLSSPRASGF